MNNNTSGFVPVEIVDCASDPFNVMAATKPVAVEIKRYFNNRARNPEPLRVLIGETHSMPTHVLLAPALISHLKNHIVAGDGAVRIAVHLEQPRNLKKYVHDQIFNLKPQSSILTYVICRNYYFAPQTRNATYATYDESQLPIKFCDASTTDQYKLIYDDPDLQTIMVQHNIPFNSDPLSQNGQTLRNFVMTSTEPPDMKGKKPHIVICPTGSSHLFGHGSEAYPSSQFALHGKNNVPVIAIAPNSVKGLNTLNITTIHSRQSFQKIFVTTGLSEKECLLGIDFHDEEMFLRKIKQRSPGLYLADGEKWVTATRRKMGLI